MHCSHCDATIPAEAKFCHACGRAVKQVRSRARRTGRRTPLADAAENILWAGTFSAKGLIHSWLIAIVVTAVLIGAGFAASAAQEQWLFIGGLIAVIWCGLGLLLAFQKLNVHYELSDQRLIHRAGILLRRTNRIELIDIDDVGHEQGIIERFFHVGTIELISSDRSHPIIVLPGIDDVEHVAMLIDDARRRERIRRGIHIEQI